MVDELHLPFLPEIDPFCADLGLSTHYILEADGKTLLRTFKHADPWDVNIDNSEFGASGILFDVRFPDPFLFDLLWDFPDGFTLR